MTTTIRYPSKAWALAELVPAVMVMVAGLQGYIAFSSTPWLLLLATAALWWRGPGWRAIGLSRPQNFLRTLLIGAAVGVGYQFVGLYAIEPLIARATGTLPDVSAFRPLIGNEMQLAFWLAITWTVAAFMEEMVYRGWLMNRLAETGGWSTRAWVAGALSSSVLFGLVHLYQGVSGVVAAGLSGLVFAAAYLVTGRNLWASILAHGFLDTAGFVMIYLGLYPGL